MTADTPNPFDGAGVFVDDVGDFPGPFVLADELQKDHFTWVAFRVHNGTRQQYATNQQWI